MLRRRLRFHRYINIHISPPSCRPLDVRTLDGRGHRHAAGDDQRLPCRCRRNGARNGGEQDLKKSGCLSLVFVSARRQAQHVVLTFNKPDLHNFKSFWLSEREKMSSRVATPGGGGGHRKGPTGYNMPRYVRTNDWFTSHRRQLPLSESRRRLLGQTGHGGRLMALQVHGTRNRNARFVRLDLLSDQAGTDGCHSSDVNACGSASSLGSILAARSC